MAQPLDPALLLKAYAAGIFPMADGRDAPDVYWVEPRKRGILPLGGFRLSRSLAKTLRSGRFETTADCAFADVVRLCAEQAADRPSTWINHQIEASVALLHAGGHAHSIETWERGRLVVVRIPSSCLSIVFLPPASRGFTYRATACWFSSSGIRALQCACVRSSCLGRSRRSCWSSPVMTLRVRVRVPRPS